MRIGSAGISGRVEELVKESQKGGREIYLSLYPELRTPATGRMEINVDAMGKVGTVFGFHTAQNVHRRAYIYIYILDVGEGEEVMDVPAEATEWNEMLTPSSMAISICASRMAR